MGLNMTHDLWQALMAAAETYPNCTLRLIQYQGWIRKFTIEHTPDLPRSGGGWTPAHVQPSLGSPPPETKSI